MAINKVEFGGRTLIDLTNDTVSPQNLMSGETAHDRSGAPIVGTATPGSTYTAGDGIDISAQNEISVDTAFTEASVRANIFSGDSLRTILGKIRKWFTDIPNMFLKLTGGTLTGILLTNGTSEQQIAVGRNHSNTTSQPATILIGNNTPDGTAGSTYGVVRLLGKGAGATDITAPDASSYNPRSIKFPDASGTVALISDIPDVTFGLLLTKNWDYSAFSVNLDSSSAIILFGARNGKAVFSIFPSYSNERCDIKNDFGITFTHSISGNTHTIGLSAPSSSVGSGCYLYFLGSPV